MGHRLSRRAIVLTAAVATLWATVPVHGALPLIAGLGKQLIQNLLIDGVKSQLMGSLSGMGCRALRWPRCCPGDKARPRRHDRWRADAEHARRHGDPPAMAIALALGMSMPGLGDGKAMGGDMSSMMALMQQQLGARAGGMPTMTRRADDADERHAWPRCSRRCRSHCRAPRRWRCSTNSASSA